MAEGKEEGDEDPLGPRERPQVVHGETEKIKVGCGKNLYLTCNSDGDSLFEVFAQLGKPGAALCRSVKLRPV